MKTLSEYLADYALYIDFKNLPSDVVHEVKRRLIDSLACAYGAYNSEPYKIAREIGQTVSSSYNASMIGMDNKTSPDLAAFANGILVRYLDYNDTYLSKEPAHPSDNIPAAVSAAEAEKADGKAFITAVVLGYEIQCRLCDAASLRARGWDHVGYVSVSSSALAGKLMGLDKEGIGHAIALGITPAIPLRQTRVGELSMWKGCAAANAVRNSVFAALLAKKGMTGPSQVFEGEKGFFRQVTETPFDLDIDNFGGRRGHFKILDTYIKYYPSEYHSQAAVEAALELRKEITVDEIETIYIETYDACVDIIAGDDEKWRPKTRETADHSLPYIAAAALYDGKLGLEQFSDEKIQDPSLQSLIDKVKVEKNPDHTANYPESFPCLIKIKGRSGKYYSKTVSYPKGHPQNPLTDDEVVKKFETLSCGLIESREIKEIMDRIWNIEGEKDMGDFMRLFKRAG